VPLFTPDWQPLINSAQGVEALTTLQRQMSKYAPKGILAWDNPDASNAFLNGDVAVLEGWPDFIQDMIQDPSKSKVVDKWAIAPYPERGTGNFTEHNVVVFKNTTNPNAAFEWATYISSPAQARRSVLQYNVSVARKSIYSDAAVVKKYPYLPSTAAVFDRGKPFTPNVPQWLELFLDLGTGISNALAGKASPKAALDNVASQWQKSIKQAPLSFK
jgi:multiple sugar transport system substrate-binding protein